MLSSSLLIPNMLQVLSPGLQGPPARAPAPAPRLPGAGPPGPGLGVAVLSEGPRQPGRHHPLVLFPRRVQTPGDRGQVSAVQCGQQVQLRHTGAGPRVLGQERPGPGHREEGGGLEGDGGGHP